MMGNNDEGGRMENEDDSSVGESSGVHLEKGEEERRGGGARRACGTSELPKDWEEKRKGERDEAQ